MADLALGHELGENSDHLVDRRLRVDAVLVVEVDVVGVESPEGSLQRDADVVVCSGRSWTDSNMQGRPVGELLDVAVERSTLDQLEVEVGCTLEDCI